MFQAQEIQISVRLECTLNVRFLRLEYTVHETRKYGIQQKKPLKLPIPDVRPSTALSLPFHPLKFP